MDFHFELFPEFFRLCLFFKICSHIFMIFEVEIGIVILVTPKQEIERKSEWFCGVYFFRSNFKVE